MPPDLPTNRNRVSVPRLLLWTILLVAGVLRLARLDLMAFEMDEGAACILAVKFTYYGVAPLLGVKTSLQFCNPPLFLYLLSPALLIATDPRFAAMIFAVLGTAAVYVVYRTGREFFSPAVGLLAAAMMALSPAAVEYSRRLWGHSLIQVLCPVAFYLLLRWVVGGRAKSVFWLALVIAIAQQFHFSGALLWCPVILAWLVFRPRTDWVALVCGLAVGLLGYVPFLIAQADMGFTDLQIIGNAIVHGTGQAWRFSIHPLFYWFCAATDLGHNNWLQSGYESFLAGIPLYRATRGAAGAAWVAGLIGCAIWAIRNRRGSSTFILHPSSFILLSATWALVPLAVFLLLHVPVVAPYFLVVYPAPFLAIAWLVVEAWRRTESPLLAMGVRRSLQGLIVLLPAAWALDQAAFNVALRIRLDRKGGGEGSYASFGVQQAAMRFIAGHAPGRTVLVTEEHMAPDKGVDYRYYYLLWTFDRDMNRFFPKNREKAQYWYVIRNTNYRIRPDFEAFLAQFPFEQFGPLRVFVIPRPGPWPRFGAAQPSAPT